MLLLGGLERLFWHMYVGIYVKIDINAFLKGLSSSETMISSVGTFLSFLIGEFFEYYSIKKIKKVKKFRIRNDILHLFSTIFKYYPSVAIRLSILSSNACATTSEYSFEKLPNAKPNAHDNNLISPEVNGKTAS